MPIDHINIANRVAITSGEKADLYRATLNTLHTGNSFTIGRQGSVYTVKRVGSELEVTQTQQSRIGTVKNWMASLFGDRLTGSQRIAHELNQLTSSQAHVSKSYSDPVAAVVFEGVESAAVAKDIQIAMGKVQNFVLECARGDRAWGLDDVSKGRDLTRALSKPGREAKHYATGNPKAPILNQLKSWSESDPRWTKEKTCALLLDLGIALKGMTTEATQGRMDFMNGIMLDSRGERKVLGSDRPQAVIDANSLWATEFTPEGTSFKSGVSGTTACLLTVLRHINQVSNAGLHPANERVTGEEIEAVVKGAAKYWHDKSSSSIERFKGAFHTPAEVWASYTYHLTEKLREDQGRLGGLQDAVLGDAGLGNIRGKEYAEGELGKPTEQSVEDEEIRIDALKEKAYGAGDEIKGFDMSICGDIDAQDHARDQASIMHDVLTHIGNVGDSGKFEVRVLERGENLEFRFPNPSEGVRQRLQRFAVLNENAFEKQAMSLDASNATITVPKTRLDDARTIFNNGNYRSFAQAEKEVEDRLRRIF